MTSLLEIATAMDAGCPENYLKEIITHANDLNTDRYIDYWTCTGLSFIPSLSLVISGYAETWPVFV